MSKVVIIGAGQTGSGFINRLLYLSKQPVVFLDQDAAKVQRLNDQGTYTISFGSQTRSDMEVDNYTAFHLASKEAMDALADADLVFTSIGEQNLPDLIPTFEQSLQQRANKPLQIITAENGVSPKRKLESLLRDSRVRLSEAIIFCTTVCRQDTLHLISEDLDWIPYDGKPLQEQLAYIGFEAYDRFHDLLERKIFTYNCLSAVVAYAGEHKGYTNYAEAANDNEILRLMNQIRERIDLAISQKFQISLEEQQAFSLLAIRKFTNRAIVDTIDRNVRDVERKLGKQERIVAPLRILADYSLASSELLYIAALAVAYGQKTDTLARTSDVYAAYFGELPPLWVAEIKKQVMQIRGMFI